MHFVNAIQALVHLLRSHEQTRCRECISGCNSLPCFAYLLDQVGSVFDITSMLHHGKIETLHVQMNMTIPVLKMCKDRVVSSDGRPTLLIFCTCVSCAVKSRLKRKCKKTFEKNT